MASPAPAACPAPVPRRQSHASYADNSKKPQTRRRGTAGRLHCPSQAPRGRRHGPREGTMNRPSPASVFHRGSTSGGSEMRVRLLGPVDVVADGAIRPVSGLRRKAVLAVLALQHGDVVRTDQLADAVWGDAPPATPLNTLQRHISYLRQVLGSRDAIVARPPGYWLDQGQVDTDVVMA